MNFEETLIEIVKICEEVCSQYGLDVIRVEKRSKWFCKIIANLENKHFKFDGIFIIYDEEFIMEFGIKKTLNCQRQIYSYSPGMEKEYVVKNFQALGILTKDEMIIKDIIE